MMSSVGPSYLNLLESGELARRAQKAFYSLADCTTCRRRCHADRTQQQSQRSYCRTGRLALVSARVARFLPQHYVDILAEFQTIAKTKSLGVRG